MHIVVLDAQTVTNGDVSLEPIKEFGELTVYPLTAYEEIADRIADADAVFCNKSLLDSYTLRKAEKLRYIGLFATGYNNIDLAYTREKGITVCNAGSYSTQAVAQHTFALILEHFNRVGAYNDFVQAGNWVNSTTFSPFVFPTDELCDKTIGLIGYGSIGKAVARIAQAFGMRVLVHTRTPQEDGTVTFLSLEEMLPQVDVLSIHCPLNDRTRGMINADALSRCKKGAFLVNTSRGPVVDEKALRAALKSGHIGGAGLDVLQVEPMESGCPLLNMPNCMITPHVAWAPVTTRLRLMNIVTDNLRCFLNGAPKNVVNG